ncbi:MAG TPA: hypothetical protein VF131_12145 [Blastocatellia bacterium]|nr:hypothetical protein [Blastocatellia bacterium]
MTQAQENHETHEKNQNLWLLTAAPAIWAGHFLLSYITASIWCAKLVGADGSLWGVRVAIAVYTVVALAGIGMIGWSGYRRHRYGSETVPHDFDTPEDRHRFLGFATLLLAALSAVATIYIALAAVFIGRCY